MSIKIMSAVFESETLGPTQRLIMLALADHADDSGRCYPSIARLCQRTGLGERAVQNNIRALVEAGYISIVPNAGQGLANLYFVRPTPAPDAPPHEVHPRTTCTSTPASRSKTPAPDAPKPSRTTTEPSEEPPLVPQADAKRKRAISLPDNWVPSERNVADAQARNFSAEEIQHEADRFRDYHLAKGTTFRDWDAGWRTWLGNARRYPSGGVARQAAPGVHGRGSSLASIVARRRAEGQV
ncbi:helix-turn-helix domain-containing protein [Falsirhodobacter sp. 20TX0035]|uniref:helix-turn-helix domain-containing protein n=1 Tax=Falsirhodobacter sp. 20TX0035 TaxID=3022019 RepID=UPI002330AF0D|nr:helix-turn-helix domain-containing protein [Falsirhodobacter sp. 20TX0035]MDB6454729.1 helix-turn-helix domain-containing protein [Falsirhodobacter sp. 20TX0035]